MEVIELTDIVVYEERGRRIRWDDSAREQQSLEQIELPSYDNSLGIEQANDGVEYRFRVVFTDENAEYVSDIAARYAIPTDRRIGGTLQLEFAKRVAFMTVYPFIRASVFSSAARLGQPAPVMGIVRQGDFEAGEQMTEDAVREAFYDDASERVSRRTHPR